MVSCEEFIIVLSESMYLLTIACLCPYRFNLNCGVGAAGSTLIADDWGEEFGGYRVATDGGIGRSLAAASMVSARGFRSGWLW